MRNVYISFLGLGSYNQETKNHEYKITPYKLNDITVETQFVQVAEIKVLGPDQFDTIIIVCTEKSHDLHFSNLEQQLKNKGIHALIPLKISEDMSAQGQWKWLEKILEYIEPDDELTIDMTHGYRSILIVFSTAINFLQQAKNISLKGVYYGAFEKCRELGYTPIINMKDFYIIDEWAEGVSRLVEDADARKMAQVAEKASDFQIGELNDTKVIDAFEDLTNTIRNIDINNIFTKAENALNLITEKEKIASVTGKILLNLVIDKFTSLTTDIPQSDRYDKNYFLLQIEITRLLLEHKLYMQAYTVMREFIGSMGMIPLLKVNNMSNSEGRKKRHKYAEIFVNMFYFEENKWDFSGHKQDAFEKLKPYYDHLKAVGIEQELRSFTKLLTNYRNGFDHAWTVRRYPEKKENKEIQEIQEMGTKFFNKLNNVVTLLEQNGFFTEKRGLPWHIQ
jgi:hypothetical protein